MISIHKYENLGHADYGWLNAKHHFSFGNYYNPNKMGLGILKVINDDIIKPKKGFDMHPHRDMEIITYVRSGTITHKDNNGNEGTTKAGDIQVMSAGTGILHSEYNLEDTDTNIYQIWIQPDKKSIPPRWESKQFPKNYATKSLPLLVSGIETSNSLFINQKNANIYGGKIEKDTTITHFIDNQVYLLISEGSIKINNTYKANKGDGIEITSIQNIEIKALDHSEILIINLLNE